MTKTSYTYRVKHSLRDGKIAKERCLGRAKKRADGIRAMTMKLTVSPATQPISRILKGALV